MPYPKLLTTDAVARFVLLAAAAIGASACRGDPSPISEASLLEYATTPYEKRPFEPRQVLGQINDVTVVADFICADVCPDYTVRIIHFDVEPGPKCARAGGVEKSVVVPIAIAATTRAFCFPKVLTDNWDAYVR